MVGMRKRLYIKVLGWWTKGGISIQLENSSQLGFKQKKSLPYLKLCGHKTDASAKQIHIVPLYRFGLHTFDIGELQESFNFTPPRKP
jgi:hypothetical protein